MSLGPKKSLSWRMVSNRLNRKKVLVGTPACRLRRWAERGSPDVAKPGLFGTKKVHFKPGRCGELCSKRMRSQILLHILPHIALLWCDMGCWFDRGGKRAPPHWQRLCGFCAVRCGSRMRRLHGAMRGLVVAAENAMLRAVRTWESRLLWQHGVQLGRWRRPCV